MKRPLTYQETNDGKHTENQSDQQCRLAGRSRPKRPGAEVGEQAEARPRGVPRRRSPKSRSWKVLPHTPRIRRTRLSGPVPSAIPRKRRRENSEERSFRQGSRPVQKDFLPLRILLAAGPRRPDHVADVLPGAAQPASRIGQKRVDRTPFQRAIELVAALGGLREVPASSRGAPECAKTPDAHRRCASVKFLSIKLRLPRAVSGERKPAGTSSPCRPRLLLTRCALLI